MKKTRDVIVTDSHPASSRATNFLQSTTESQQRQNSREIVSEEYTNKWGERNRREVSKKIQDAYERIVFWKKNLFMPPTGAAAKIYITETTKLMNGLTNNSPLKDIAFKAIHIMPSFLLQKPSKTSKAKDHLKALERIDFWGNGKIDELLLEGETIQSRLHHINTPKNIGELSKKFALLTEKGNVNGALKLLTSNISKGIMPLDDKTLSLLKQKHPASSELTEEVLLRGEKPSVHSVVLEDIDENMVKEVALKAKGGSVQELRNK